MDYSNQPAAIPEQRWVVAELEASQELFEEAPMAYLELDAAGIVRRINRALCELLGYSAEEIVGKPIWMFSFDEEDEEGEKELSRKAIAWRLAAEEPLVPCRCSYIARDQHVVTVVAHNRLMTGHDGQPIGIRTALLDITERVVAEARLMESQKWLTTTLDSLAEGVLAVDPLGAVKFINRCAQELLQWPAEEAVGRDVDELFSRSEIVCPTNNGVNGVRTLSDVLNRSHLDSLTASMVLSGRHGKVTAVELASAPVLLEGNRVVGVVIVLRRPTPPA
jgi:PAS domain S-box-containing protein